MRFRCPGIGPRIVPGNASSSQSWSSYWTSHYIKSLFAVTTGATTQTITAILVGSGYSVSFEYSTDNVNFTEHGTSTDGNYSATGLTQSIKYYWRARPFKGSNYGSYSVVDSDITYASSMDTGVAWYDSLALSTLTKDSANMLSVFGSRIGTGNALAQSTAAKQPAWGLDGVLTDAINDFMTKTFTYNQPEVQYIVFRMITHVNNRYLFDGGIADRAAMFSPTPSPTLKVYAGTQSGANANLALQTFGIAKVVYNGANGKFQIDETAEVTGNFGASNAGGFHFGSQVSGTSGFSCLEMKEAWLGAAEDTNIYTYLRKKHWVDAEEVFADEKFDGVMQNSVEYSDAGTHKIRSSYSEYKFNYSGKRLYIKGVGTLSPTTATYSYITILVDGVYYARISLFAGETGYKKIILPSGDKVITLVESQLSKPAATVIGCFLTSIKADSSFSKIAEIDVTSKFVFLGDSILNGAGALDGNTQGISRLYKMENGFETVTLGWGYGRLASFAANAGLITTTVGWITTAFANCTSTKKLVISVGTNDYGLDSLAAATFQTYYENLLDAIHSADEDILIYCVSPLLRGDAKEDATLDDYRARIGTVCAARSDYATHIAGKTILSYPADYFDVVHPTTAGQKKFKDAVYAVTNP